MKQAYVLFALLIIANCSVYGQLYCRNNTDKDVWVAVAYNYTPITTNKQPSSSNNWISEGWYFVPAKGITQLSSHIGYHPQYGIKTNFFYYAMHKGGRDYVGGRMYLIDTTASFTENKLGFRIQTAHSACDHEQLPNLQFRPFRATTIQNEGKYTIAIDESILNDEPIIIDAQQESYFK